MGQDIATNRLLGVCLEAEGEGCTRCLNFVVVVVVVVVDTTGFVAIYKIWYLISQF